MITEVIDNAIKTEGVVEMEYSKDGVLGKSYLLRKVAYSAEYGDKCFRGCPIGSDTELTFRIDKVKDIQLVWNVIIDENIQFEKSGIYALAYMGDNYIGFGLYSFEKGEKLLDHHSFDLLDMLAYHYIPYYSETNKKLWHSFDKTQKVQYDSVYVIAYTIDQEATEETDDYDSKNLNINSFKKTKHSGIYYTEVQLRKGESLSTISVPHGINILAYSCCPIYTEKDLGVHNKLRNKKRNSL